MHTQIVLRINEYEQVVTANPWHLITLVTVQEVERFLIITHNALTSSESSSETAALAVLPSPGTSFPELLLQT